MPAITFGHLTHASKGGTVWSVRAGRFLFSQDAMPSTGDLTTPSRTDSVTGITSGAPPSFAQLTVERTTGQATISHYSPGLLGADHQWKVGTQLERGGHHAINGIPTGVRFIDVNGQRSQAVSVAPFNVGGLFVTAAALRERRHHASVTGSRSMRGCGSITRAPPARICPLSIAQAHETAEIVRGLGTLYTWNLFSPRVGVTAKLTADGRTMLRASYGRFSQGVMTGELEAFHPGATATTTTAFDSATGGYTIPVSVVDPRTKSATRCRDARAALARVLHRGRSRSWPPARGGGRLHREERHRLHRMDRRGRPICREDADVEGWSQRAGVRAPEQDGGSALSVDEPRGTTP